ncbi:Glycine rich protein, partial [Prevotellaceae bacterium MN60]
AALLLTACTQDIAQEFFAGNDDNSVTFTAQTIMTEDETRSVSAPEALPLTGDGLNLWLMPSETPMAGDATRGTQINSVSELSSFGVSAFKHGAIPSGKTLNEYLTDNHLKPDFFYNMEATKVTGTEKFKLTTNYYWPASNETLSFFAYAPYGDGNVGLSAETAEGPQVITFKVNTVVKDQADFMTAQASSTAHTSASETPSVRLNFTHHLTGVRFVLGDQFLKGWVKSISLKGVYTEGKYTIGGNWTLDDTKKGNFTISYNMDKPVTGTPGETVTAPNETFLMIPHTFADDDAATIEVVYNDGYTDYIVSAPLKGQTWKAGKTVTYAITSKKLTTLQISSITFPTTPLAADGMPDKAKAWQAGDKVGMYVVGSDGMKLKHKNIPVTFDGTKWNIDHTTAEGTIYKLPGESFYFYYPYSTASNNQPLGYPEQCPELKAEAPVFFEGVIDYFPIKTNQSVLEDFISCDLMVAKAEDEGHASTIKATMERQVGIAVIKLATKTIPETITYLNNVQQSTSGTYTITASNNFLNNIPKVNGGKYYFFTKVGGTTTFNSITTEKHYWTNALEFNLGKNAALEKTAQTTVEWDWTFKTKATYNYDYQNKVYSLTAPSAVNAYLEVWGAQGSEPATYNAALAGKGGYSYGNKQLSKDAMLYVCVGRKGYDYGYDNQYVNKNLAYFNSMRPYNGGGYGHSFGGGATHIASALRGTGVLADYKNYKGEVVIVAGGGGGCEVSSGHGGAGGGTSGGDGSGTSGFTGATNSNNGKGGTQTAGGAAGTAYSGYAAGFAGEFGLGGHSIALNVYEKGSGGGGGWYGGGGSCCYAMSGGGGSGYIGGVSGGNTITGNASQKQPNGTTTTGHSGNGYARITLTH